MHIDKFKVEEWFNEYEPMAKYNLADICIDSMSINELLDISGVNVEGSGCVLNELYNKKLGYGDIQGSKRLKEAILSMYNSQNLENITVTHGAIGANELVYKVLVEKGDEVISILPAYQQHYSIPKSLGANVKKLFLKPENNWLPDIDELKLLITPKTKLISMTNPNNPTGSVITDDLMKEIISLSNGAYIFVDEVYKDIVSDEKYNTTSIADLYEKGISTSSLSKAFSLAGLRVGWVVASKDVIENINHHREYNTISVSILDDYFASIAIENKEKIFKRNIRKRKVGLEVLKEWLKTEPHISCVIPNGATSAFIHYDIEMSSYDLCKKLLKDTGILLLPGETLEMDKFLRMGYCNNPEKLKITLNLFSDWIKNNS